MSMFASYTTAEIPVPGEPGQTVTLQKLSGRDLEIAEAEHLAGVISGIPGRGWAGRFQAQLAKGTATEKDAMQALADPLSGYDRLTLVKRGLKAWSFLQPDGHADAGKPKPLTAAAVEDIDDDRLEHFAIEIMRLTKPALFKTPAELEADRKKG